MAEPGEVEQRAVETGWRPLTEWTGAPDRWVDAETWVRRGEEMLPILKANNRKLEQELARTRSEISQLVQSVQEGQESIKALKEYHDEDVRRQVGLARERLKADLIRARKDDDIDGEVEAQAALTRLEGVQAEPPQRKEEPPKQHPDFPAWHGENPWYGINHEATGFAMGVAQSLQGRGLTGRVFLDKITERVAEKFPDLFPGRNTQGSSTSGSDNRGDFSKVEGSRIGSIRPNGRSYADLPQDARDACERMSGRLVGKTRAFKTVDEWRAEYVRKYFAGNEYV